MEYYLLPCSPEFRCLDRFSILPDEGTEDEDGMVCFWPVLEAVLSRPVVVMLDVVDCLDDIAVTLRGSTRPAVNYETLTTFLASRYPDFCSVLWVKITQLALGMPVYFPTGRLPVLLPGQSLELSRGQTACLVAHQFLRSLAAPAHRDEYYDFGIWFSAEQRHPRAVAMYLDALFRYFDLLPLCGQLRDSLDQELGYERGGITYALHTSSPTLSLDDWRDIVLSPLQVAHLVTHSTSPQDPEFQGPYGAVVVSANKVIGFGESATQEELYVGNTPEACPAVLLMPILQRDHVLTIFGAQPMLRIRGERRDISWEARTVSNDHDSGEALTDGRSSEESKTWIWQSYGSKMIFMDALELDEVTSDGTNLADLAPANITRELRKAVVAFSSFGYHTVWTPLWGCGAFCGDPAVKMTILWIAASVAGVELRILCEETQRDFGLAFEQFVRQIAQPSVTAASLQALLSQVPRHLRRLEIIHWMMKNGVS